MAYTLKDGYVEIINVASENRDGECKAGEALKQGMAVSKSVSAGVAVANKADGTGLYEVFIVKRYNRDEVKALYTGYSEPSIASGERVVLLGKGVVATDQYVGDIGDYDIGDYLEIGTGGDVGLFTNYNATPVGDPMARVYGKDDNKLLVQIIR